MILFHSLSAARIALMSARGVAASSEAFTSSSSRQSGWRCWTIAIEGAAAAVTSTYLAVMALGPPQA